MQGSFVLDKKERPEHWQNMGPLNMILIWIPQLAQQFEVEADHQKKLQSDIC